MVVVIFFRVGCAAVLGVLSAPAVAAVEDVLDALVCRQFGGKPRPRCAKCAAVEILDLGGIARFAKSCAWSRYSASAHGGCR